MSNENIIHTVENTSSTNLCHIKRATQLEVKEESIQLLYWVLKALETGPAIDVVRQRIHERLEKIKARQ